MIYILYIIKNRTNGEPELWHQEVVPYDKGSFIMATSLKIDDELKTRVQHLASVRDRSPHWIMREAIKQYAGSRELQARGVGVADRLPGNRPAFARPGSRRLVEHLGR